jgi:chorismate synthase
MGIRIGAHITAIGKAAAPGFDPMDPQLDRVGQLFPTLTGEAAEAFQSVIEDARKNGDSVGGTVECAVTGLPAGIGEPMFGGVESRIAQIIYGIPAVKGLQFGDTQISGSENNDAYCAENGCVRTATNHCGGILGGITNGMPLMLQVQFKPTPSIFQTQISVDLKTGEQTDLQVQGRHDPCIVPRAVPVVEAAVAIAIYDMILGNTQTERRK